MKLINSQMDSKDNSNSNSVCYFTSDSEFILVRVEAGVRINYVGSLKKIDDELLVIINNKDRIDDDETIAFRVPFVDLAKNGEPGKVELQSYIVERFNRASPSNKRGEERKVSDTFKWALMGLAVVLAVQVGSCVRNNYLIQERIKIEKGYGS